LVISKRSKSSRRTNSFILGWKTKRQGFPEECIEAAGGDVALKPDADFMETDSGESEHAQDGGKKAAWAASS
jgi:hypothetical protein